MANTNTRVHVSPWKRAWRKQKQKRKYSHNDRNILILCAWEYASVAQGQIDFSKNENRNSKKGLPVVEKFILRKLSICSFILLVTILTKQLLHTDYSDVNTISKVRLSRSVSTNVFTCFCCISHLQIWRIHHGVCWNSHLCCCLSWKCYYTIYVVFPLQWQTEQETRDKRRTAFGGGQRCIAKSDPHLHD